MFNKSLTETGTSSLKDYNRSRRNSQRTEEDKCACGHKESIRIN